MEFNAKKCEVIHFSRTQQNNSHIYNINGKPLAEQSVIKYLGVSISNNLDWSVHVQNSIQKATDLLAMLQRQLKYCTWKTKLTLYKTIVRPTLDYASCVWSPHLKYLISDLEKVQRRAVRWIKGLKGDDSITAAMIEMNVETLLDHRMCRDSKVFK